MHQSHGGNQPSLRENIHIREFLHGRGLRPICDPPTDTKTPLYRIYTEVLESYCPETGRSGAFWAPPIRTKFSEDQALFTMTAPSHPSKQKVSRKTIWLSPFLAPFYGSKCYDFCNRFSFDTAIHKHISETISTLFLCLQHIFYCIILSHLHKTVKTQHDTERIGVNGRRSFLRGFDDVGNRWYRIRIRGKT